MSKTDSLYVNLSKSDWLVNTNAEKITSLDENLHQEIQELKDVISAQQQRIDDLEKENITLHRKLKHTTSLHRRA